jgi:microcystin-dependent protein
MPTSYSPSLKIALPGDGEQAGIWGQTTNNNLGTLLEQAIAGLTTVDVSVSDVTLTSLNGTYDQARSAVLAVTGTPTGTRNIIIPNEPKVYTVLNNTGYAVTIKTASGTGYACPAISQSQVQCDGAGSGTVTGISITAGANAITSSSNPFNSPAFTGVPTAPTAVVNTNTTQLATTQFVQTQISSIPSAQGVPTGAVFYFAMVTAPANYLVCDGSAVSRTTYSNLFAAIGVVFGAGDGVTTFNLPDLRGEFVRGYDGGRGVDPGRVFGTTQSAAFASHTHSASSSTSVSIYDPGHAHFYVEPTTGGAIQAGGGYSYSGATTGSASTGISAGASTSTSITATGGTETRPVNVSLLPCIKT